MKAQQPDALTRAIAFYRDHGICNRHIIALAFADPAELTLDESRTIADYGWRDFDGLVAAVYEGASRRTQQR